MTGLVSRLWDRAKIADMVRPAVSAAAGTHAQQAPASTAAGHSSAAAHYVPERHHSHWHHAVCCARGEEGPLRPAAALISSSQLAVAQVLLCQPVGKPADIFSLGVVFFEVPLLYLNLRLSA